MNDKDSRKKVKRSIVLTEFDDEFSRDKKFLSQSACINQALCLLRETQEKGEQANVIKMNFVIEEKCQKKEPTKESDEEKVQILVAVLKELNKYDEAEIIIKGKEESVITYKKSK